MWNQSLSTAEVVPVQHFFQSQSSVDLVHAAGATWAPPVSRARCWASLQKRFRPFTERWDEALSVKMTQNLVPSLTAFAGCELWLGCCVNTEFNSAAATNNKPGWCRYRCVSLWDWDGATAVLRFTFELSTLVLHSWESGKKDEPKKIFGLMILQLYPRVRPVFQKWSGRKWTNPCCGWIPQIPVGRKSAARQCTSSRHVTPPPHPHPHSSLVTACTMALTHTSTMWAYSRHWLKTAGKTSIWTRWPECVRSLHLTAGPGRPKTPQRYQTPKRSQSVAVCQFRICVLGRTQFKVADIIALRRLSRITKHRSKLKMQQNFIGQDAGI